MRPQSGSASSDSCPCIDIEPGPPVEGMNSVGATREATEPSPKPGETGPVVVRKDDFLPGNRKDGIGRNAVPTAKWREDKDEALGDYSGERNVLDVEDSSPPTTEPFLKAVLRSYGCFVGRHPNVVFFLVLLFYVQMLKYAISSAAGAGDTQNIGPAHRHDAGARKSQQGPALFEPGRGRVDYWE
ncbi:unnamed protein product, partial [Amoebophrya sp. A120]|eukprot:GSA120T00021610001.1